MPNRRQVGSLAALSIVAASSCLFSTNPPKSNNSGPTGTDPNVAVVTGLVQFYDRTDGHTSTAPDWLVRADWYINVGAGQPPRLVSNQLVHAGRDGVYEVRYTQPDVVAVHVMARICTVDLDALECCLGEPPCNKPECTSIWTTPQRIDIKLGVHEQRTLRVGCTHAP